MGRFTSARLAWALSLVALAVIAALSLAWLREREALLVERVRLEEAHSALQRESGREQALADQVSSLRDQMTTLGNRVSGLERDNNDLRRRLANAGRPHLDIAALAPLVEAVPPAIETETLPSIEARLIGEPSAIEGLRLAPASTWPVVERLDLRPPSRLADPAFMKRMYFSYGALQVVDIGSTIVTLQRGGQEANPLLKGVAGHPAALLTVKAATTVGTVLLIEKLRKTKPVTAAVMLAAINSTLAVVAVNNVKAARAQKPPQ